MFRCRQNVTMFDRKINYFFYWAIKQKKKKETIKQSSVIIVVIRPMRIFIHVLWLWWRHPICVFSPFVSNAPIHCLTSSFWGILFIDHRPFAHSSICHSNSLTAFYKYSQSHIATQLFVSKYILVEMVMHDRTNDCWCVRVFVCVEVFYDCLL